MACGKLLHSLDVRAQMLQYLFSDGRRAKSGCEGCVWSATMLVSFQMQHLSMTERKETLMIFSAASPLSSIRCRVL